MSQQEFQQYCLQMANHGQQEMDGISEESKVASDLIQDGTMPGLHQFVRDQYEKQKEELGDVNVEEERINNFFARAVSESRRMSREVEKSQKQQLKLYAELGKETFGQWREEHAAQVLPGHSAQQASRMVEDMDQA